MLPQLCLPQVLQDDLYLPTGTGLPVVSSFLAELTLQAKEEEGHPGEEDDRVTISTIHRAKGLEWDEVYVPFLNESYLPTNFRKDNINSLFVRHISGCSAQNEKNGITCDKNCAEANTVEEENRRHHGLTAEQSHADEERRLAHVATTRAKERLVFVSILSSTGQPCKESTFVSCLTELDETVFQKTN